MENYCEYCKTCDNNCDCMRNYDPEECEDCGKFECVCYEVNNCTCGAWTPKGYHISDCICGRG